MSSRSQKYAETCPSLSIWNQICHMRIIIVFFYFSGENIKLSEHIIQLEASLADLKKVGECFIIVLIT